MTDQAALPLFVLPMVLMPGEVQELRAGTRQNTHDVAREIQRVSVYAIDNTVMQTQQCASSFHRHCTLNRGRYYPSVYVLLARRLASPKGEQTGPVFSVSHYWFSDVYRCWPLPLEH